MPLELVFSSIDEAVDNTFGKYNTVFKDAKDRTLSNYSYSIGKKYELIFEVVRHLNNDFKIIREYIMQDCTNMHDDIEKVVDIADFQTHLATIFETKGVLTQFKNENIPAPKKSVAVNEAKVKTDNKKEVVEETKELLATFNKDYNKFKIKFDDY